MHRNLLICLLFFCWGCQDSFRLIPPDSAALMKIARQGDFYGDVVHIYFTENYLSSGKKDIKTYDYDRDYECGFTEEFEGGIVFKKEQCVEAGGVNWWIELPKVPEQEIKEWIERLYAAELPDWPGKWTSEFEYGTASGEAGCYYSLAEKSEVWQVIIWCGS